eukprot:SAG31_NODE_3144_length_4625_cov_3.108926_4_plen_139_part_00
MLGAGLVDIEVVQLSGMGLPLTEPGPPTILTMERSWSPSHGSSVKIFAVDLNRAPDVSGCTSFESGCAIHASAEKTLVIDLSELGVQVDNYEAMAAGPLLPDGSRLLLLVNDDNFNAQQIGTQFLAFKIKVSQKCCIS